MKLCTVFYFVLFCFIFYILLLQLTIAGFSSFPQCCVRTVFEPHWVRPMGYGLWDTLHLYLKTVFKRRNSVIFALFMSPWHTWLVPWYPGIICYIKLLNKIRKMILCCGFPPLTEDVLLLFSCLTWVNETHLHLGHKPQRNNMWEQRSAFCLLYSSSQTSADNKTAKLSSQ